MHARRTTSCVLLATGKTMRPGLDVSRDETFTLSPPSPVVGSCSYNLVHDQATSWAMDREVL